MSYTKRQFVEEAYAEIGYSSEAGFDLSPERLQRGGRRLDAMIETWNGRGIHLAYPIPGSPEDGSLDDETNVPDAANEAIILNLAMRLAPGVGKTTSPDTRKDARAAYMQLLSRFTKPAEMQFPSDLPRGQGNKPWRYEDSRFFPTPDDRLETGDGDLLELQ